METLFLRLVNLSITAGWLVLAVIVARLIFRRAPRWIFCALWGLVALRLVCPFSIESGLSLIPSAETFPRDILYTARPQIHSGLSALNSAVNPILSEALAPDPAAAGADPAQVWSCALSRIWLAGMAAMLAYALISYLMLRRRMAEATLLEGNIKQSERTDTPFVLGLFRPAIYLPYGLAEEDLPHVIAHERAHICRKDHWWKPLGFALLSVYWFQPLLWAAYVLLCRDIETACDERVIRKMDRAERRAYSTALLNCSVRRRRIAACPLAFGETGVKERIRRVMDYRQPAFWIVAAALAVCAVLAVCFLTDPPETEDGGQLELEGIAEPGTEGTETDAMAPGTVLVSWQCLFMNPLSSTLSLHGDSGCRYAVGEDDFTVLDRSTGAEQRIEVPDWNWQPFPYTDGEWAALFPLGMGDETPISQRYEERLYQPLTAGRFLLRMDGELWLVDLGSDPRQGDYLWSIFSLVPESSMGSAQWEYAPLLSSRLPVFRFSFDLGYDQLSAACAEGTLVDFGGTGARGHDTLIPAGTDLYWSPVDGDGPPAGSAEIRFTAKRDGTGWGGTLCLTAERGEDGTVVYTADLVGTGLHLSQDPEGEGAVISLAAHGPAAS